MSTARKPQPRLVDPGDGMHALEVHEKNTETTWALFHALQRQQQHGFDETAQAGLPDAAQAPARPPNEVSVDDVLVEVRRNNRVCPVPAVWNKLYEYLPNKTSDLTPAPRTPQEWMQTPAMQKRAVLRSHVEWAAAQGVLKNVHKALLALPENKWHHMGE
jgi:hypothetical protein